MGRLGIFVAILLVLIFVPLIVLEYCCLPAGTLTRWLVGSEFVFDQFSVNGLLVSTLCIWLFTWMFFRLALGLPHLAVRAADEARLASWALTARLEPAATGLRGAGHDRHTAAMGAVVLGL